MNSESGVFGDFELAGRMLEEHEKRDQQVSVEVFEEKYLVLIINMKLISD